MSEQFGEQEELNDDEVIKKIAEAMQGNAPSPEEKQNAFTFIHAIATSDDTKKTGYLKVDKELNELGIPELPLRTYHSLAIISDKIMNNDFFRDYFLAEGESVTATSLSREGFLAKLAILQKREIKDTTPKPRKPSSSWFKPKERPGGEEE